jgi:UDP-N-acetylglucosamine acyltransferase
MIHPAAVVDKYAELGSDVEIGAYCVIGPKVKIGKGTKLVSHVCVQELSEIGEGCTLYPFVVIGGPPQDLTYRGEDTTCVIGNNNTIREYVTINRGSKSSGTTSVGSDNYIMAYSHIAHDCRVGSHVIMANCATLAGHVHVEDYAILSGLSAAHQFCRIGKYAFISGLTGVPKDIPPFMMAAGNRARLYGLNAVGLERQGFAKAEIVKLKRAYRILFRSSLPLEKSLKLVEEELDGENIKELLTFIRSSERGICR